MQIVTYSSENAPPERKWVAYWQVGVREKSPEKKKSPPDKFGIMPYSFWGATEEEVIAAAQQGWDTSFGKGEKAKRDQEALISKVRSRSRG